MSGNPFYITTTLPYVNADPHIGFALEIVQADAIARYRASLGDNVIFNTGTDEHGQKIYQKAQDAGLDTQTYVDGFSAQFEKLKSALNLSYTHFIRTTDAKHKAAAQAFWEACQANGDIYKKNYQTKYCVGCELEKTDSELVDDACPDHPTYTLEARDEENYFFRFSNYGEALVKLYTDRPNFVLPDYRLKEIRNFVEDGLNDFSISRLKEKMPWGVPVPGDEEHVMYVWFDALVNYISTLGWPNTDSSFETHWPGVQIAGKDNLRQQSAMWQAMLLSAGIKPSTQILIHGFITANGMKMSKSIGNVVNPFDAVNTYGTDPVRYYLLREIPFGSDGDYSDERMKIRYAELANDIGNLVQRTLTMAEKYCDGKVPEGMNHLADSLGADTEEIAMHMKVYKFQSVLEVIFNRLQSLNKHIEETAPWKAAKEERMEDVGNALYTVLDSLRHAAVLLKPFLPETADKIIKGLGIQSSHEQPLAAGTVLQKGEGLFPRLES